MVVTGCMANADPDALAAMPEVTRVLGNREKERFFDLALGAGEDRVHVAATDLARRLRITRLRPPHPLTWFPVHKAIDWTDGAKLEVVQLETLIGQLSEFVPTSCLLVDRERFLPIKTREDLAAAEHQIAAIARAAGLHP